MNEMGYQIRTVSEVAAWLAELRITAPATADLVDEAVMALRTAGESLGPPLVVPLDGSPRGGSRPDLDAVYQRQLDRLTWVRRRVADVATARKRTEMQVQQMENQGFAGAQLAEMRERHETLREDEAQITATSQRLQGAVDAFRVRKEAIKAAWAAADATAEAVRAATTIEDAIAEFGSVAPAAVPAAATDARPAPRPDPRPDAWPAPRPDAWPAAADGLALELFELLPGAPDQADVRILFTVEEPGIAVLLAAGAEADRLHSWYAEAILDCRARYRRGTPDDEGQSSGYLREGSSG